MMFHGNQPIFLKEKLKKMMKLYLKYMDPIWDFVNLMTLDIGIIDMSHHLLRNLNQMFWAVIANIERIKFY